MTHSATCHIGKNEEEGAKYSQIHSKTLDRSFLSQHVDSFHSAIAFSLSVILSLQSFHGI